MEGFIVSEQKAICDQNMGVAYRDIISLRFFSEVCMMFGQL